MVVVDLGGGLAVARAQDPAGVLEEASVAGDGRGEEQGVQRRAVKPFPGVRASGDSEQGRPAGLWGKPGQGGGPVLGAHAALEDDRVVPEGAEGTGDLF